MSVQSQLVKNNEILVYCLKTDVFLLHVLNKNENIINAGYWVLSENRKVNSQQKKQICPNRKKLSSRKTQKIANAQK